MCSRFPHQSASEIKYPTTEKVGIYVTTVPAPPLVGTGAGAGHATVGECVLRVSGLAGLAYASFNFHPRKSGYTICCCGTDNKT